eukprot:GFUD01000623.1.p1 GENE.GFUD01000623.1~~GFUD01000623.1.p1  ORF type:complete len:689 (-),score=173.31 GFUD01000623.1:19-1851(-)
MCCLLPPTAQNMEKDPKVFRKKFQHLRLYFSDNLVRPVYEALSTACRKFVCENRLKYGDVILSLVFQDCFSQSLELTAKHLVFRKWTLREEMCLQRTLRMSTNLVKLSLPGKGNDKILILISKHCQLLEDLDISTSYVTDTGLLAICGVEVEEETDKYTEESPENVEPVGNICHLTGKTTRAAAVRARARLDQIKTDPSFLRKLAIGSTGSQELKEKFSLLTAKMKPFIDKRLDQTLQTSWSSKPGFLYTFSQTGCRRLTRLDLTRTNYPKRSLDANGKRILTLGLTRDSVLAALILLQNLKVLKWIDLGEILQLYEMVCEETCQSTPQLQLLLLMDSSLTMDKLEVANRICPRIVKLDISMFNFSFAQQDFLIGALSNQDNSSQEERLNRSSNFIFNFTDLKDLEVQYMDDSRAFNTSIQNCSSILTRICLNKMISISFETLAAVKTFCKNLEVFEVFVDKIYTFNTSSVLEQVIAETENTDWTSLKSLKLGGSIPTGSVLKFLILGCSNLRVLCYSPYEAQAALVTDLLVEQMLAINPCKSLVAFYFEKCFLTEQTFFLLLSSQPRIRYVGILAEWFGMDRRARLAIKAFLRGNNVDVDIDSVHEHDL